MEKYLGFKHSYSHQSRVENSILSTLIACLPNESIVLLHRNEIFVSTPTPKPQLFNYAAFCKVLSIFEICRMIDNVFFKNEQPIAINSLSQKDRYCLVAEEIIKMFMNQISSLKKLDYFSYYPCVDISFTCFSGRSACLADLSALRCNSNIHSEFFYQLSQVCRNLQSLSIIFKDEISNGLKELISLQNNLNNLNLFAYNESNWKNIIPALEKHSNSLTKLHLYGDDDSLPLSFIASFSNLQEIKLSFIIRTNFEDFKKLQNVSFPKLKILKIPYQCPKPEYVIKFLENNGKHFEEFCTDENDNFLNLSIAKFCPNLKKLFVIFNNGDEDILKTILNSCQYLESIKVWCGRRFLSEKEILEAVAKHSPERFCELIIVYESLKSLLEGLESFFTIWKNRTSKKLLSLIIINDYGDDGESIKIIQVIEKHESLGIIKKFEIKQRASYEEIYE